MHKFLLMTSMVLLCLSGCQPQPEPQPVKDQSEVPRENAPADHPPSQPAMWSSPGCATSPFATCTASDFREADFRRADLSGHVLFFNALARRARFQGANLSNTALHFIDLENANLAEANLSGAELPGANLQHANLSRTQLRGADCMGCNLTGANLQDGDLHGANLHGATFAYADLRGAVFIDADLSQVFWHQTRCPDATLSHNNGDTCGGHLDAKMANRPCQPRPGVKCPDADLNRLDWRTANLEMADLEAADLRQTLLNGARLAGANLAHAILRGADLRNADLVGANLLRSDLEKVQWKNTRCPDGTLSSNNGETCGGHLQPNPPPCNIAPGGDCRGADLQGYDLSYAHLMGANLQDADLRGARLVGAILQGARMNRANLEGADLRQADLRNALTKEANLLDIITKGTICNSRLRKQQGVQCSKLQTSHP